MVRVIYTYMAIFALPTTKNFVNCANASNMHQRCIYICMCTSIYSNLNELGMCQLALWPWHMAFIMHRWHFKFVLTFAAGFCTRIKERWFIHLFMFEEVFWCHRAVPRMPAKERGAWIDDKLLQMHSTLCSLIACWNFECMCNVCFCVCVRF